MPVIPDPDPGPGDDTILAVRLQELRDTYPATVRAIASRWADGLKALLGLAGTIGLLAAPFATDQLSDTGRTVTGLLLVGVFLAGAAGLWLTMSAAYGVARVDRAPQSLVELQTLRRKHGDLDRSRLVWGRRSAIVAIMLLAAAVGAAWTDPWDSPAPLLKITTVDGVSYCGELLDAPEHAVAVHNPPEGRVELPMTDVASVHIVESCAG